MSDDSEQKLTIAKLEGERDGWKAKCEKMWNEQDKPFTDLLHANLKLATLQGKLDRAIQEWGAMCDHIDGGCIDQSLDELIATARSILSDLKDETHDR